MSRWKDQFNSLTSNVVDFTQRVASELTAENEIDPTTELQYHKDQAIKFERDLVKCQSDLTEKNKEIEALTDSVREAFEEVEHQLEQLRDFQNDSTYDDEDNADSSQLALELDIVRAEKASLSDELTALNNKLQYYQAQLAVKSEPVAESNQLEPQELELLRDELIKSNNRVESLRQEMSNLLERNHHLLNECTERQEFCQELEHKLSAIQNKHVSAHSVEIEKLSTQISQLNEENVQIKSELSKSMVANEELVNQIKRTDNYETEVSKLDTEINRLLSLTQNSTIFLEYVDKLKDENSMLSNQLAQKIEDEKLTSGFIEQLKKEHSRLLNSRSNESNDNQNNSNEAEINQLKTEIEERDQQIQEYESKLQQAIQTHAETEDELNKLKEECESKDDQIQAYSDKLKLAVEQQIETEDELNQLKTEIEERDQQIHAYEAELKETNHQKTLIQNRDLADTETQSSIGDSLSQELIEARSRIEELETEIDEKQVSIQHYEATLKSGESYVNELKSSIEELRHKIKLLEDGNDNFDQRMQVLEEENGKLKVALDESEQTLTEVMENRKNFDKGLSEELSNTRNHVSELETEIMKNRSIIEQLNDEKTIDKTLIEDLNMSIFSLREQNDIQGSQSQQDEIVELREKLDKYEKSLKKLSEQNNTVNSEKVLNSKLRIQELESEVAKNQEIIREINASKRENDSEINELKLRIAQLTREIESLRFENNKCVQNIQSLEEANDRMKTALIESESSLNEVMTDRKNLEEGNAESEIYKRYTQDRIERKQQELDDANAKIQQKENEIDYYRTNLEKQQHENDQLHRRINNINSTIKDLQATYAESQTQLKASELSFLQRDTELRALIQEIKNEKSAIEQKQVDTDEKLKSALSLIDDQRAEIELLEERVQSDSDSQHKYVSGNQSTSSSIATFVIPPELRQFIVSAITCDEQQRAHGALLLASLIDCTAEERQKVEQSYKMKSAGWTSIFRSQQADNSQRPKNTREFLTQFVDFLERESSIAKAANIEQNDPIRLDRELQPHSQPHRVSSEKDLNSILNQ